MEVKPGREAAFIGAMVDSGPYSKLMAGFANEKLLEPLPAQQVTATHVADKGVPQDAALLYLSFSRYYDKGTAQYVEPERLRGIESELQRPATRLQLTLIEHALADWGWEKGSAQSVLSTQPLQNDEIFQKNISSLSFFKAGYVGQVGMVEFFEPGTELAEVRAAVTARSGLSGASIYQVEGQDADKERYVAYSEFFRAPPELAELRLRVGPDKVPAGGIAGVVVQNYMPR
jgi:hypothetical protein